MRRRPLLLQPHKAQGRVSPALTDGKRAPSAKAPEGSHDTAPCWDTEPPHTLRPFPDPAGQQSPPFTLLAPPNLPAHARRKRETFTTAPGDPNTCSCSGPAGAPNTVGYKTTGNTNIDLYFKFPALYLQKRAGGKRLPAQSPRGGGGGSVLRRALRFSSSNFYSRSPRPSEWCSSTRSPGLGSGRGPGGGRGRLFLNGLRWCLTPRRHTPPTPHQAPLGARAGSPPGSEGHALTTPRRWIGAARRTLGHDPEDGVVAADAGAVLLVVLLGVTHLEELRLGATSGRGTSTLQAGRGAGNPPPVPPRRETPPASPGRVQPPAVRQFQPHQGPGLRNKALFHFFENLFSFCLRPTMRSP